jgi:hypothetical protein
MLNGLRPFDEWARERKPTPEEAAMYRRLIEEMTAMSRGERCETGATFAKRGGRLMLTDVTYD